LKSLFSFIESKIALPLETRNKKQDLIRTSLKSDKKKKFLF
jgi:hypothetical protein